MSTTETAEIVTTTQQEAGGWWRDNNGRCLSADTAKQAIDAVCEDLLVRAAAMEQRAMRDGLSKRAIDRMQTTARELRSVAYDLACVSVRQSKGRRSLHDPS